MSVRTKYYLDKQNAKFKGVLAGVADYFGVDVTWVRLGFLALMFTTGAMPLIGLYLAVAWFGEAKPPALYLETPAEQKFYATLRTSPARSIRDTRSMYRDVDRRLQDIEAYMTSSNSRLDREIDALR